MGSSEVSQAFGGLGRLAVTIGLVSCVYNVLLLSGSFFMLLVYDDVLPSRSIPSLASLFAMVMVAYVFQAFLDFVRNQMLVQAGALFTRRLSDRVYDVLYRHELEVGRLPNGIQIVRDVDTIRSFINGPGPVALLDLPWVLIYLLILAIFHWSLGLLALAGVVVLLVTMMVNDRLTQSLAESSMKASAHRYAVADATLRNGQAIRALGMQRSQRSIWHGADAAHLACNERLSATAGTIGAATHTFRMLLQSASLALGAYLVIEGSATGGVIIASSILTSRTLAPIEQVIATWKSAIASRQASTRMTALFRTVPWRAEPMGLTLPHKKLALQGVFSGPPGTRAITIAEIGFELHAGDALAVVGRSGSGKTTLARVLCGVWPALRGSVRLDGATLDQWSSAEQARILGYVPQSIELFEGTIAQNIARFDNDADREAILAAARAADVHDMIVTLESGYEHWLAGSACDSLSAGQQQRIALARALYGDPFLLVLDEPNSNLDYEGEKALGVAIEKARARGAIVVIVAHRPTIIEHVSHVLVMDRGKIDRFGLRDQLIGSPHATAAM